MDHCDTCDDLGIVYKDVTFGHPDFGKAFPCPSCWRGMERRQRYIRSINNLDAYQDKTFDTFNLNLAWLSENQKEHLEAIFTEIKSYAQSPTGWLVLYGGLGIGKTHLAAAIAHECIHRGEYVIFTTVPDLLDHLRSSYSPNSETSYNERFELMRNIRVLVLDDLGTESSTPWVQEKLYQLIDYRYNKKLPTVITTNISLLDLEPRIASRIQDDKLSKVITLNFPDVRQRGHAQDVEVSDLSDLSQYKDMRFDTLKPRVGQGEESLKKSTQQLKEYIYRYSGAKNSNLVHASSAAEDVWRIIVGGYGAGKTHLAAAVAHLWQDINEIAPLIIRTADLLDYLRATFEPNAKDTLHNRFNEIRRTPLLILDDFHLHDKTTPWSREKLFQLVDYRYLSKLPTIFIIAEDMVDILKQEHPDFHSRLTDGRISKWIFLKTGDYRKRFKV